MKRFFVILAFLLLPHLAFSQLWSGVLDAPRGIDWSTVGASHIGDTRTRCTTGTGTAVIPAYTGTSGTIQTALDGCDANHYVELGAGTFTITGFNHTTANVTLKGQGADSTKLVFTGNVSGCGWGLGRHITMAACNGSGAYICQTCTADHTVTWSAGYSQGTTAITLSSTSGLAVGSTIWLYQDDDAADYPASGDVRVCLDPVGTCSNHGGGEDYVKDNKGLVEGHNVTAISGSTVTIDPPIAFPTFRAGQTPVAAYGNTGQVLLNAGIENLSIKEAHSTGGIYLANCSGCWVKGVRIFQDDTDSTNSYHIATIECFRCSFVNNYLYGPATTNLVNVYGFALHVFSFGLVQNNILHSMSAAVVLNSTVYGSVISFNYMNETLGASVIEHGISGMNLVEGNNGSNYSADIIQATHQFGTLLRNNWDRQAHNSDISETEAGTALYTRARFYNSLGNVFSNASWTLYQSDQAHSQVAMYETGWQGTGSGTAVSNDARVKATLYRFGNYDNVTAAVRWCGNSGNTGWVATCGSTSEVPTGITNYAETVPAAESLPNSFYMSAQPTWWGSPYGTVPWPAIGPEVTGSAVTDTGGHAYKTTARLCFENATDDPAYPTSNPRVKVFSASTCYVPQVCVASKVVFTAQPSNAVQGVSVGTISIAVQDSGGIACTSDTSTVTLAKTGGTCTGMTLNGTVSGSASSGVFTTSDVNLTVATGGCTLTATDSSLTSAVSNSFTISSSTPATNSGSGAFPLRRPRQYQ